MTLADDLIAVRTLLILKGRARGTLTDGEGRVCLRQAMLMVSESGDDVSAFEDPAAKAFDEDYDGTIDPYNKWVASRARDCAMYHELLRHLRGSYLSEDLIRQYEHMGINGPDPAGNSDILSMFNDAISMGDQDVFDLIDKTLAELGAL